jgi:hypothetical protein
MEEAITLTRRKRKMTGSITISVNSTILLVVHKMSTPRTTTSEVPDLQALQLLHLSPKCIISSTVTPVVFIRIQASKEETNKLEGRHIASSSLMITTNGSSKFCISSLNSSRGMLIKCTCFSSNKNRNAEC